MLKHLKGEFHMVTIRQHEQEASAEYTECTQCGVEELSGDIVDIDDRKLCKDCIHEDYTLCSDCDQWVKDDTTWHDPVSIAECYGRWCQEWICSHCVHSCRNVEDCEFYGCADCFEDHSYECFFDNGYNDDLSELGNSYSHIVRPYTDKFSDDLPSYHEMKLKFHGKGKKKLGVENETQLRSSGGLDATEQVMDTINGVGFDHVVLKEDASISGTEVVSQPCDLQYHHEQFGWDRLFRALLDDGHYSDLESGLHIHVNRSYFSSYPSQLLEDKLLLMYEIHEENWTEVSGGKNPNNYADRFLDVHKVNDLRQLGTGRQVEDFVEMQRENGIISRHKAINFTKGDDPTYEFRFLRSTLDFEVFKARTQAIDILTEFVNKHDVEEIMASTWDDVVELAIELDHEEFVDQFSELKNTNLLPWEIDKSWHRIQSARYV